MKWQDSIDDLGTLLRWCPYESDFVEHAEELFNSLLKLLFTEEGIDTINWWLYEKSTDPDLKMSKDGEELPCETLDDLWLLIREERV